MAKQVTLTIDDRTITAPEGMMIVDAAKQAGVNIPVFCYHPKLKPAGMCRVCLVEIGRPLVDRATGEPQLDENGKQKIGFGPKLETACTTPVSEGMVVVTTSDQVTQVRKEVLELLLTSHPLDCPVCDKGGECPLQNLTLAYGPAESRFKFDEKKHLAKHVPLGELIYLDRERCIQCGRCVRFMDELVGEPVIGFHNRGRSTEIATYSEPGFDSIFSGNTTDICPVGALTTADFRFGARPWEMKAIPSVCNLCPVGCNVTFSVRREAKSGGKTVIKRVMPRQNEMVNELWLCDKGRFGYHFVEDSERLLQPMMRREGPMGAVTWDEALDAAAEKIKSAGSDLVVLAGGKLSNEDYYNLNKLASAQGGRALLYSSMAGGDLVAQVGVGQGSNISDMGAGSAIMVVASDLHEEAPIWYLRIKQAAERGAAVIVVNPRATALDSFATHVVRYEYGKEVASLAALLPLSTGNVSPELKAAAEVFEKAENAVIFYGSEGLGLAGSAAVARSCAELLVKTGHTGKANNGLVPVWDNANLQGAWDMGFKPAEQLEKTIAAAKVVYVAGADIAADDAALAQALQKAGYVIVQDLFMSESAKWADVVLPAAAYTEREGSYTSGERRVQRFYQVVAPHAGPRADFAIASQLGARLGVEMEGKSAKLLFDELAKSAPGYEGVTFTALAETVEQYPPVSRKDLFYTGTAYSNEAGVGVQLAPASQQGKRIEMNEAPAPQLLSVPGGDLMAVPVTRVYAGQSLRRSQTLEKRMAQAVMRIHPQAAQASGLQTGDTARVKVNGTERVLEVKLDDTVPAGVALLPRAVGLAISQPAVLHVEGKQS